MIRPSTIFWLLIVSVLGFGLFHIKYEVQALEDDLSHIRRDIATQQEAIHVLRAEWTFLVQADRLQTLSSKFLSLTPLTSAQITTVDQLPMRPPGAPPIVQPQLAAQNLLAVTTPTRKPASPTGVPGQTASSQTSSGQISSGQTSSGQAQAGSHAAPPPRPVLPHAAARSTPVSFHADAKLAGVAP